MEIQKERHAPASFFHFFPQLEKGKLEAEEIIIFWIAPKRGGWQDRMQNVERRAGRETTRPIALRAGLAFSKLFYKSTPFHLRTRPIALRGGLAFSKLF